MLIAAFSVKKAPTLPPPDLPATFDTTAALDLADELAGSIPNRKPGTPGARKAASWVASKFELEGFTPTTDRFTFDIPGEGPTKLANVTAIVPGRSPQAIVLMSHRDDTGVGPGANDNASGTGAMLELARVYASLGTGSSARRGSGRRTTSSSSPPMEARSSARCLPLRDALPYRNRVLAVVDIDAIAGKGTPALEFAGDAPRSPPPRSLRPQLRG